MAERLNAPVSKTGIPKGIGGSNPPISAVIRENSKPKIIYMENLKEKTKQTPASNPERFSSYDFFKRRLKSYIEFEENWADALARLLTRHFGTLRFLTIMLVFILLWIVINLGLVPGVEPFDENSLNWLMVIIQLFGIFFSIIVLISQNREEKIDEIYQKMDFEINVRSEHEVTKILQMLDEIHKKLGISKPDSELEEMKEKLDIKEIKEEVEQVVEEEEKKDDIL